MASSAFGAEGAAASNAFAYMGAAIGAGMIVIGAALGSAICTAPPASFQSARRPSSSDARPYRRAARAAFALSVACRDNLPTPRVVAHADPTPADPPQP